MCMVVKTMIAQTPLVKHLTHPQHMEIILNDKANLTERFADINAVQVRKVFAEVETVTRYYPKRMARVFKIPNLSSKLVKKSSKKAATF